MFRHIVCLLLILGCAPLAFADNRPLADDRSVGKELRSLAASVDRLANLLEQRTQETEQDEMLRKLDIAISYLNFRSRRIENLQRQLLTASNSRERIEDILKQWDLREESLADALRNASTADAQQIEQTLENARIQRKVLNEKLTRLDSDVIKLENRLYELQNRLDDIEQFVQKNLTLQ